MKFRGRLRLAELGISALISLCFYYSFGPASANAHSIVCQCDSHDPFDPQQEALIKQGPLKGKCIACFKRSVQFVDDKRFPLAQQSDQKSYWVANVVHNGHFWVAEIPRWKSMAVIFQFEYTPYRFVKTDIPGGHSQLRFHFEKKIIKLFKQNSDGTPPQFISDIVFSNEPALPVGVNLDYGLTIGPNYPILYEMSSLKDVAKEIVLKRGYHTEQYRLVLTDHQKDVALKTAIELGTIFKLHTMYRLLWRNCATESFQVLNVAQNYDSKGDPYYNWDRRLFKNILAGHVLASFKEGFADLLARYPNSAWETLKLRGLVNGHSRLLDLEREMLTAEWAR